MELATDEQFQAWVVANNLLDLIEENGIVAWSFDDRVRLINHAIRRRRALQFVEANNLAKSSASEIVSKLFEAPDSAS